MGYRTPWEIGDSIPFNGLLFIGKLPIKKGDAAPQRGNVSHFPQNTGFELAEPISSTETTTAEPTLIFAANIDVVSAVIVSVAGIAAPNRGLHDILLPQKLS